MAESKKVKSPSSKRSPKESKEEKDSDKVEPKKEGKKDSRRNSGSKDTKVKRTNLKKTKSESKVKVPRLKDKLKDDPEDKRTKDVLGVDSKPKAVKKKKNKEKDGKKKKKKKVIRPTTPKGKAPVQPRPVKKEEETKANPLHDLLKEMELNDVIPIMDAEEVDMETFLLLSDHDLAGMNVPSNARKQILIKILQLSRPAGGAAPKITEGGESKDPSVEGKEDTGLLEDDDRVKAIVVHDFAGDEEEFQLSLAQGDLVYIVERHDSGWWWAETPDGRKGYFPQTYLKITKAGERKLEESNREDDTRPKKKKEMRLSLKKEEKANRLSRLSLGASSNTKAEVSSDKATPASPNVQSGSISPGRLLASPGKTSGAIKKEEPAAIPISPKGNGLMSLGSMKKTASMRQSVPEDRINTRRPSSGEELSEL